MRCRQAKKLLFDHIDGVISESDRVGLERHLAECRACEAAASALSRSLDLLHRVPSQAPSENFNWKLRLELAKAKNSWRDAAESERTWPRAWDTRFAVGAASAFLAVLVAGAVVLGPAWRGTDGSDRFAGVPEPSLGNRSAPGGAGAEYRPWDYSPFAFSPSGGFVSRPVASGPASDWENDPLGRASGLVLNADSLRVRYMESRLESQRIRRLEQQIELLHDELEKCGRQRRE